MVYGVKFNKSYYNKEVMKFWVDKWSKREATVSEILKKMDISRATFYVWKKKYLREIDPIHEKTEKPAEYLNKFLKLKKDYDILKNKYDKDISELRNIIELNDNNLKKLQCAIKEVGQELRNENIKHELFLKNLTNNDILLQKRIIKKMVQKFYISEVEANAMLGEVYTGSTTNSNKIKEETEWFLKHGLYRSLADIRPFYAFMDNVYKWQYNDIKAVYHEERLKLKKKKVSIPADDKKYNKQYSDVWALLDVEGYYWEERINNKTIMDGSPITDKRIKKPVSFFGIVNINSRLPMITPFLEKQYFKQEDIEKYLENAILKIGEPLEIKMLSDSKCNLSKWCDFHKIKLTIIDNKNRTDLIALKETTKSINQNIFYANDVFDFEKIVKSMHLWSDNNIRPSKRW